MKIVLIPACLTAVLGAALASASVPAQKTFTRSPKLARDIGAPLSDETPPYGMRATEEGTEPTEGGPGPGPFVMPGIADDGTPLVFPGTRVAANGGSLRNCASTGINLVGVPAGSMVVQAYLYWGWASLAAPVPGLHDTLLFGRLPLAPAAGGPFMGPAGVAQNVRARIRPVVGTLVGAGPDPCWLGFGNFVYRADVTAIVTRGGSYVTYLPAGAAGATDWSDPWGAPGPTAPLCEGASLVVVYVNPMEPLGTTYIYDVGLAGTMFLSSPGFGYTLGGFFYPGGAARWIHVGADGQSGGGYLDIVALGAETTTIAGLSIAGGGFGFFPPSLYNDSDWNGSANKPLGQLWDTSGHDITGTLPPGAGALGIFHAAPAGIPMSDCLVPVCDVLWMM